jgi:hypothetical protein
VSVASVLKQRAQSAIIDSKPAGYQSTRRENEGKAARANRLTVRTADQR